MKKLIFILLFFICSATVAWAQQATNLQYTPLEPLPGVPTEAYSEPGQFGALFNSVFILLISLGALLGVVTLVISGIMYMTSEATDKKSEARSRIRNSIIGLILLAGCYLVLSTINPDLLRINFNPRQIVNPQNTNSPVLNNSGTLTPATNAQMQAAANECRKVGGGYVINADGKGSCEGASGF
jgi:hypothetical protein